MSLPLGVACHQWQLLYRSISMTEMSHYAGGCLSVNGFTYVSVESAADEKETHNDVFKTNIVIVRVLLISWIGPLPNTNGLKHLAKSPEVSICTMQDGKLLLSSILSQVYSLIPIGRRLMIAPAHSFACGSSHLHSSRHCAGLLGAFPS